jgi:hypothetical protein
VLNGVGGRTVEEAKGRMSYAEALQWREFLERRGTVHLGMRLEAGFALIALSINRAIGGKAKIKDFMPHLEEVEATPGDIMGILTGAIGPKK